MRPQFKREYTEYCRKLPKTAQRTIELTWRNQRAMELLSAETDEVKQQVEQYRQTHRFASDSDSESSDDEDDDAKTKRKKAKSKQGKITR